MNVLRINCYSKIANYKTTLLNKNNFSRVSLSQTSDTVSFTSNNAEGEQNYFKRKKTEEKIEILHNLYQENQREALERIIEKEKNPNLKANAGFYRYLIMKKEGSIEDDVDICFLQRMVTKHIQEREEIGKRPQFTNIILQPEIPVKFRLKALETLSLDKGFSQEQILDDFYIESQRKGNGSKAQIASLELIDALGTDEATQYFFYWLQDETNKDVIKAALDLIKAKQEKYSEFFDDVPMKQLAKIVKTKVQTAIDENSIKPEDIAFFTQFMDDISNRYQFTDRMRIKYNEKRQMQNLVDAYFDCKVNNEYKKGCERKIISELHKDNKSNIDYLVEIATNPEKDTSQRIEIIMLLKDASRYDALSAIAQSGTDDLTDVYVKKIVEEKQRLEKELQLDDVDIK